MDLVTILTTAAATPPVYPVARPSGVVHAYQGPLTPSGRYVPAANRTACRAHTRRLTVVPGRWSTHAVDPAVTMCARCAACLTTLAQRQAAPTTRDDHLTRYRALTVDDLAAALDATTTTDDCHKLGYLTQLLHGPKPLRPRGKTDPRTPPQLQLAALHDAITSRRRAIDLANATPEDLAAARLDRRSLAEASEAATRERKRALWADRQRRIAQYGITNT